VKAELIMLRLGELTLKGRNRSRFEHRVMQHIRKVLESYPRAAIDHEHGRIYIVLNGEPYQEIADRMSKVFGLSSFSPVLSAALELDDIQRTAVQVVEQSGALDRTFKVSVRRANKAFPIDSQQMNQLVAGYVLQHLKTLKVDVHHPEIHLHVEIREKRTYLFTEVVPGLGGFPIGTNGKAMLMLSGGIDSPVAGYLALKKGLKVEAVHFHSFPYTSERAQEKVVELASVLAEYTGGIRLHMVPFTELQMRLKAAAPENLLITLMRRAMMRITERLAHREEGQAIVTGESLGQVASQTLSSMHVIGQVVKLPVLRPLVMMDKSEIIPMAQKLGTYETSILPYEDCCTLFVPKSPSTNPNLRIIESVERRMTDYEQLIEAAVNGTELIRTVPGGRKEEFTDLL
jgi:tRNA uracil 4-sulfurtransferase